MFDKLIELLTRFVTAQEKQADAAMLMATRGSTCACTTKDEHAPYASRTEAGVSDGTECTAGHGEGEAASEQPGAGQTQQSPAGSSASDWDPYKAAPMKAYRGEKLGILRAELKRFGLEPGDKMTGYELHALLLEQAKNKGITDTAQANAVLLPQTQTASTPAVNVNGYAMPVAPAPEGPVTLAAPPVPPMAPAAPVMAPPVQTPPVMMPPVAAPAPSAADGITIDVVRKALNDLANKGPEAVAETLRLIREVGGVPSLTEAGTGRQLLPNDKLIPLYHAVAEATGRF